MADTNLREMLELAAKAAGLPHKFIPLLGKMVHIIDAGKSEEWSPHLDDGDSARLRSSRMMDVDWTGMGVVVIDYDSRARFREPFADHNNDRNTALRMATLRCAAEEGRRMK